MQRTGMALVFSMIIFSALGQGYDSLRLTCLTLPMGDSVIVKWMPTDYRSWQRGNRSGYQLERITLRREGRTISKKEQQESKILLGIFFPLDSTTWVEGLDTADRWDVLAAGSLYGEEAKPAYRNKTLDLQYMLDRQQVKENRFALAFLAVNQSLRAAQRMGLAYTDKRVDKGAGYEYRVRYQGDSTFTSHLLFSNSISNFPPPQDINTIGLDRVAHISWDYQQTAAYFFSYDIEKSVDGGKSYVPINQGPILQVGNANRLNYLDSLDANGIPCLYRIRGRSPFGIFGPYSESVRVAGVDEFEYYQLEFPFAQENETGQVVMAWSFPASGEKGLKGFMIKKAREYDGPWTSCSTELANISERSFVDPEPWRTSYYRIEAVYWDGKVKPSSTILVNLSDLVAPEVPVGLQCMLDTIHNELILDWQGVSAEDLWGYKIYISGGLKNEFFDLTDSIVNSNNYRYPIQARQNGEILYFRVASIDFRYNISKMSAVCSVQLLDSRPPPPPLIRKIIPGDTTVLLEYACSPDQTVVQHIIQRRTGDRLDWDDLYRIETTDDQIRSFVDRHLKGKVRYQYRIVAVDPGGNQTPSKIRTAILNNHKTSEAISFSEGKYDTSTMIIKLSWEYLPPDQLSRIYLYRAKAGEDLKTHKNLTGKSLQALITFDDGNRVSYSWSDANIKTGTPYIYAIRAILRNGESSLLSDTIEIKVPEN